MKDGGTAARQFDGPDRIGPYQLLAKLAEGGMGTVYLARMTGPAGFTKLAVVKQLKEDLLGSRRFAELFLDEARLAARLTHPNVVHTYGAGEDDGHLYLAMEYLDGQPWSRVQRRLRAAHALPLKAQLKVLTDTLNGLHYAHELKGFDGKPFNVVHCDISPQNVFVTYDGQVKVVDFGVARAAHNKRDTGESVFLGKVGYCAPEQARGEAVDRRADIFSVGVMLFEALTGERFSVGEGAVKTLRNRGLGKEPRIGDMAPDVPDALAHICDRALALSADERYPTAAEFRAELVECMAQSGQEFEPGPLGRLVSNAFEAESKRVHQLIEKRLQEQTLSGPHVADVSSGDRAETNESTLEADLSRLASITRIADEDNVSSIISANLVGAAASNDASDASLRVPARKGRLWISLAVLLASGGAFLAAWFGDDLGGSASEPGLAGPARNDPGTSPTTDHTTQQQAHDTIAIQFSVTPPKARLFLDGSQLDSNPFSARLKPDNALHTLEASAEGYAPARRSIVFDRDVKVAIKLNPAHPVDPVDPVDRATSDDDRSRREARRRRRRAREKEQADGPLEPTAASLAEPTASDRTADSQASESTPAAQPPQEASGSPGGQPASPAGEPKPQNAADKRPDMNIYDEDPY